MNLGGDGQHDDIRRHGVEAFLRLFNDDHDAAIDAIRHYSSHNTRLRTEPSTPIVISVRHVSRTYKRGATRVTALDDVSLNIHKGEIVALTGASGSGKSTLLQILGCVDRPSVGSVIVDGRDVALLHDAALSRLRRAKIGFVFQSFYLQPFLRLADNVAVPAMFTSKNVRDIDASVKELVARVGLEDRIDHLPKELSGGQIQRAAIARALINNPDIIIADEPTGNLDSRSSQSVVDLLKDIRDNLGTTIIIATHDRVIASQADRVIRLKDGVIL